MPKEINKEINIFDRKLLRSNRNYASKNLAEYDFLFKEVATRIIEKVADFKQDFQNILEIGARDGFLGKEIQKIKNSAILIQSDCSFLMAKSINSNNAIVMDDELLSFKEQSFDLIISNCGLHFINDLPGTLIQIKRLLKKDGLFIAGFFGGQTLKELREVFYQSEFRLYGGVSPRIIPFIDVKNAGMLVRRAGFANCVTESETVVISYQNPLKLLKDLKNMGEGNILFKRSKRFAGKNLLSSIDSIYRHLYADKKGDINANFEIITINGWS